MDEDYHELRMSYYDKALALDREGKTPLDMLREASKMGLLDYEGQGIKRVAVLAAGDRSCFYCRKVEGAIYSIDEALEKMPIPNTKCSNKLKGEFSFCRRTYASLIN